MQSELDQVLGRLNSLLQSDGSRLVLVDANGDSIVLRFEAGQAGTCERCAIDLNTMEMLVREAVNNHLPAIKNVRMING